MNKEAIQEKIDRALRRLAKNDSALLDSNVNERSITHQLCAWVSW
jgi:hypothetical protein